MEPTDDTYSRTTAFGEILDESIAYLGDTNSKNQPHGYGRMINKDKSLFQGDFVNGLKYGDG